jgi:hypothetical protein
MCLDTGNRVSNGNGDVRAGVALGNPSVDFSVTAEKASATAISHLSDILIPFDV